MAATTDPAALVQDWDEGAWCLAALAVGLDGPDGPLRSAARSVIVATGLRTDSYPGSPQQLAAQAAAPLHITATLAAGRTPDWAAQSDEALLSQGKASSLAGQLFARYLLPMLGDFAAQFTAPGARMLDVGTGTGALAVGYAEAFPQLEVVGIDIFDRALALAAQSVSASPAAARITFRKQDVAALVDPAGFDLAWLPAPFIPPDALSAGLQAVARNLRPGGLVLLGHGRFGENPLADALNQFKTLAYGGTPLDDPAAAALLTDQGLSDVRGLPVPPGAPALTIGRRL